MEEEVYKPLNTEERYLCAIITRLDAVTQMLSSLVEAYAEKNEKAHTNHKITEEKPAPKKSKKK